MNRDDQKLGFEWIERIRAQLDESDHRIVKRLDRYRKKNESETQEPPEELF